MTVCLSTISSLYYSDGNKSMYNASFKRKLIVYPHRHFCCFSDFVATMNSLNGNYPWNTKLSSAGLVYFHYGHQVLGETMVRHDGESAESWKERMEYVYCNVYKCFIEAIDGIDNGIRPYDIPKYCYDLLFPLYVFPRAPTSVDITCE